MKLPGRDSKIRKLLNWDILPGDKVGLIAKLRACSDLVEYDSEMAHVLAEDALLDYINDLDVSAAFDAIQLCEESWQKKTNS